MGGGVCQAAGACLLQVGGKCWGVVWQTQPSVVCGGSKHFSSDLLGYVCWGEWEGPRSSVMQHGHHQEAKGTRIGAAVRSATLRVGAITDRRALPHTHLCICDVPSPYLKHNQRCLLGCVVCWGWRLRLADISIQSVEALTLARGETAAKREQGIVLVGAIHSQFSLHRF